MLVLCGFGWAKPVEIDPRYYKAYRSGQLKVSAAGPLANLFLCFVAVLIMTARGSLGMSSNMVNQFLYWLMLYNVWFAFFNLIPIPPLDGSKILETFMDYETAYKFERFVGQYGFIVLVLIVYSGISNMIIGPLASWYLKICYGIASILF